ncbi:MAG: 8-amino-7-oxononanoate synthase, partial [Gammaproteobacteria bacterium]
AREVALRCWQGLLDAGIYTNLILPPAAPDGGSLIRVSVTAAHSEAQVERIASAFADVVRRHASGCAA